MECVHSAEIKKTSDIVVGDSEYTCLCRDCYLKNQKEKESQLTLQIPNDNGNMD